MAINWRDCIVLPEQRFVWVAYQSVKPYLPIAVADTSEELASIVGVEPGSVRTEAYRFRSGRRKRAKYARVYVGGEV